MEHEKFMRKALLLAKEALNCGEVPVGCVIVNNNFVIATGYNNVNRTKNATRHAEIVALEKLRLYCTDNSKNFNSFVSKCVLYVTTEPCIMCAAALRISGLKNIYYGCPNQRFGGCGSRLDVATVNLAQSKCDMVADSNFDEGNFSVSKKAKLDTAKVDIQNNYSITSACAIPVLTALNCRSGILPQESIDLLKKFYCCENPSAPLPKKKDGRLEKLGLDQKIEN